MIMVSSHNILQTNSVDISENSVFAPAQHGKRLDSLDGIRTVAVFLVIAFHLSVPRMNAGYLGVDIFFVLSGFLITRGLVHDIETRGRLRLGRFWSRRMKRLMPAALLTTVSVLAWANWFIPLYRQPDIGKDAFYTVFYLANWHFVDSVSYFSTDGNVSPLMHMWSLAVEEQFYLVWPLLITFLLGILRVLFRRNFSTTLALRLLGGLAVLIVFTSAGFLYYESTKSINLAYMATHTKAFEPMLGAFCAIATSHHKCKEFFQKHARFFIWSAGGLMIWLFAILDGPSSFYFSGGGLLFSCAVALFILGIIHALQSPEARILAWSPISYLGRISYGLYLWHWPWTVWILHSAAGFQPVRAVLVILLTIATASISYHFLEMPVRSGWIGKHLNIPISLITGFIAMLVVALLAGLLGGTPISKYLQGVDTESKANSNLLLVVGDSVPKRLVPVLAPIAQKRGLEIVSAARGGCSPLAVYQDEGETDHAGKRCLTVADAQEEALNKYHPGYVLWWSRYEVVPRYDAKGNLLTPDMEDFWIAQKADLDISINRLTKEGATLVFVLTERPGRGILERSKEELNTVVIDTLINHDIYRQRFNELIQQVSQHNSQIKIIDGDSLFCSADMKVETEQLCDDNVLGKGYIRPDGSHVNNDIFGAEISTRLLEAFDRVIRKGA